MASIRDLLNTFSLADQYKQLEANQGIQNPEEKAALGGVYEQQMGPLSKGVALGLAGGAASTAIDFPIGVAETVYNIGKNIISPFEEVEYSKFPRIAKDTVEEAQDLAGPLGTAATFVGGFAGGGALASVPIIGEALLMNSVQGKLANAVDDLFANKELGNSLLQEGLKLGARVGSRAAAGSGINVITDTGYNLAEATDEQGNVNFDQFAKSEVDSALFGAVMGGGVSLADPKVFKSTKDITARLLKGSFDQTTAAVKKSDEAIQSVKVYEEQKAIEKQIETLKEEQMIKAPETEVDIVNEVADLNTKDMEWAQEYQKARDAYSEGLEETLLKKDPIEKVKETKDDIVQGFQDGWKKVKDFHRVLVEPVFREIERMTPFGTDIYKTFKAKIPSKTGAELATINQFMKTYDDSFKGSLISNLGKKLSGEKTDQAIFSMAVQSQDFDSARAILANQKNPEKLLAHFDDTVKTLQQLGEEAVQLGELRPESLRDNYWPREVRDHKQMQQKGLEYLPEDEKSGFKFYVEELTKVNQKPLTPRQYAQALDKYYAERVIKKGSNFKERKIGKIFARLFPFYHDPIRSAQDYIVDTRQKLEKARLLKLKDPNYKPSEKKIQNRMQKLLEADPNRDQSTLQRDAIRELYREQMIYDPNKIVIEQDIEQKVQEYKVKQQEEGLFKGADDEDLKLFAQDYFKNLNKGIFNTLLDKKSDYLIGKGLLAPENKASFDDYMKSVFVKANDPRPAFSRGLSNFGYGAVLGNIQSAIAQVKDIAPTMSRYGVSKALKTYMQSIASNISGGKYGNIKYTVDDLYLDKVIDQLYDNEKSGGFVNTLLKPLGFVDKIGKEGAIQASLNYWQKAAQDEKGLEKLANQYGKVFTPKEFESLADALRKKEDSPLVRDLMLYEVGKVVPTSFIDRPKAYLDNPNARIFYDLKSYMLKRQDYIYNDLLKTAKKTGDWGPMVQFFTYAPLLGYSVDYASDFTRKDVSERDVVDQSISAFLDTMGLKSFQYYSRYGLKSAPVTTIGGLLTPAGVSVPFSVGADLQNLVQGDKDWDELKSLNYIPIIGPTVGAYIRGELPQFENNGISETYSGGSNALSDRQSQAAKIREQLRNR